MSFFDKRTSLILVFLPGLASAQSLGTKADFAGKTATSTGPGPFIQMILALGVVLLLLKFALPKLAGKLHKKIVTPLNSSLKIEESAQFAGGALYVVSARNKAMLLSVSSTGVQYLADLTDGQPKPEPPLFMEVLQQEVERPEVPVMAIVNDDNIDRHRAQEALSRLARLVG
ncbi:MAG: hypothetical protein ABL962_04535 [Fimbriimonadaceae bacterium]